MTLVAVLYLLLLSIPSPFDEVLFVTPYRHYNTLSRLHCFHCITLCVCVMYELRTRVLCRSLQTNAALSCALIVVVVVHKYYVLR